MASIGRYEIEREIGRGSMGVVYLAHDPHVRRRVAVKTFLLPPGLTSEQEREYSARFLREAQAAGSLSHPSIVTIFDADTDPERGLPFIVMELVEGGSLRDLLIRDRRLEPDRALAMVSALADALRVAHDKGIVHRDIKPANVLLRAHDGQAKIVDFGVARMSTSELTGVGDVFGSPAYMSPEQFRGAPVDARSDLFSLATILYQTLCGERPFAGDDMSSLAYSVVHTPAVPIAGRLPGSVRELDRFFEKALAKDPADRYPDARAFRDAIDELRGILAQQETVKLSAHEARRTFALPSLSGPALASLRETARAAKDKIRQTVAAQPGAIALGGETETSAAAKGTKPRGISPLEGAFAVTMLVLAILPGLWALWTPGPSVASAQSRSTVRTAAPSRSTGNGDAGDEDSVLAGASRSVPPPAPGLTTPRGGSKGRAGSPSAPAPEAGRKASPASPPRAAGSTKTAAARATRPAPPRTDAAKARAAWAPRESAPPDAGQAAASAQDGALASLAAPMSRDPLARSRDAVRAKGTLVIDARSLVKEGNIKILVDGREVHHRRLSTLDGEVSQSKGLFRRREETFTVRVEVDPGSHTVAAQVFIDGKDDGREASTEVSVQARETAHLRLIAGRVLGASVSLKTE